MRVVVIGAGAIGTLYGGWLLSGGADVTFIARGRRFHEIKERGITINGRMGETHHSAVQVFKETDESHSADVIIFAVKLYDLSAAAFSARGLLASNGLAIGLQNGVEAWEILSSAFEPQQVMVGPVYSAARLTDEGAVRYDSARNDLVIGAIGNKPHPYAEPLVAMWRRAGVEASVSRDIRAALWTKLLALATNAALTCLSRQPAGVVYHETNLLELAKRSIAEVAAVANAEGVTLAPGAPAAALDLLQGFPHDVVASMRQDLDAGRPLELDGICGAIVRRGRSHGIPTPLHDVAYACLKPFANGTGSLSRGQV